MNNILTAPSIGFDGFYLIEVIQQDGTLKQGSGLNTPFKNLLLDNFFKTVSPLGNGDTISAEPAYCKVGTGSTPPSPVDTYLASQVARIGRSGQSYTYSNSIATGYWRQVATPFTFPVGSVVGNISEIGVSNYEDSLLLSRSLIKDGLGNPTTITLTATDQLKVKYTLRRTQPTTTTSGVLTLVRDGVSENHPWVWYPGIADSSSPEPLFRFSAYVGSGRLHYTTGAPVVNSTIPEPIAVTQDGAGATSSYNSASKTVTMTYTFNIGKNFPNGFNIYKPFTDLFGNYSEGYFYFPTPITKTATQKLVITSSYSMVAL